MLIMVTEPIIHTPHSQHTTLYQTSDIAVKVKGRICNRICSRICNRDLWTSGRDLAVRSSELHASSVLSIRSSSSAYLMGTLMIFTRVPDSSSAHPMPRRRLFRIDCLVFSRPKRKRDSDGEVKDVCVRHSE